MFFETFTDPIYITSALTNYTFLFWRIYIVWREYKFIKNVEVQPPVIRHYMDNKTFDHLKELNLRLVFTELIEESWLTLVHLVFADELSHLFLWNLSSKLTTTSDEMVISGIFIFLTTCKEFLVMLPISIYRFSTNPELSIRQTIQLVLGEFFSMQLVQFLFLSSWAYSSSMLFHVSKSSLILSFTLFLLLFVFTRDFFLTDILIGNHLKPLTNSEVLNDLRPFLKRMKFPEKNIYLYNAKRKELPNAFTVGHKMYNNEKIVIANNIIGENPHLNQCCHHKEVVSILMHELGHVYHHHIGWTCLMELVITISTSTLFILLYQARVFAAFGFPEHPPSIVSMLIRMDMLFGFNMLCQLLFMLHLRLCEYQADLFSFTFTRLHFRRALVKICLIRPEDLQTHDPLYSAWNFSHPTLIERLKVLFR